MTRGVVVEELVAGDPQHVRAEAAAVANAVARLDAREKRSLHQIVDIAVDLVAEEPRDGAGVTREELAPGGAVARTP